MPTLRTIAAEIEAIVGAADDGELCPDAEAMLDALQMSLEEKCENICRVITQAEADAEVYRGEAKRLTDLARAAANRGQRLKAYLKQHLESLGIDALKTELFHPRLCRNSLPTVIVDGSVPTDSLPGWAVRVEKLIDRMAIIEAVKGGWEPPAGVRVETHRHLRIT